MTLLILRYPNWLNTDHNTIGIHKVRGDRHRLSFKTMCFIHRYISIYFFIIFLSGSNSLKNLKDFFFIIFSIFCITNLKKL